MPTTAAAPLIRPSEARDLPAIAAIYAHHVLHGYASFETVPPDAAELGQRRTAILEKGLPYPVAEIDGTVMGYAYAGPYRPRIAYRFAVEDSIYVANDAPRRGIGREWFQMFMKANKVRRSLAGPLDFHAKGGASGSFVERLSAQATML